MPLSRLLVHSSGRPVASAWPLLSTEPHSAAALRVTAPIEEQSALLRSSIVAESTVVFAHSLLAVPAVLASTTRRVAGLVLVEPALYDLGRGLESIERHIGIVTDARDVAASGDLRGFWAMLRPLMFGGPLDDKRWSAEMGVAAFWATRDLPWGHGVRDHMLQDIPTLVVTGGWNDEYESIAAILAGLGADHTVLSGAQHRPQDLPGFAPAVSEFERSLEA
ncbi:hypothetical protein [Microbacterium sp. 1.5R]|uniref:hypothetical protein n=1 Tax=Microbacterium sp. 1.5R TaxID=1916917 RepID=UPI00119EC439|nr:hypothetical protein [Microbacterium sp. 1.5R]